MRIDPEFNKPIPRLWRHAHESHKAEEDAFLEQIALNMAYDTLPPHLAQVVGMRKKGASERAIAEALGITRGQLGTLLRHIENHVQRELGTG